MGKQKWKIFSTMDLENLTELAKNNDRKFSQLAEDFAEQVYSSRDLMARSRALLKKKFELNSKMGITPRKRSEYENYNDNPKTSDRSEMAKNQAKDPHKRTSQSKKAKYKHRSHHDRRRDWPDWDRHSERRGKKKPKFNHFTRMEKLPNRMNISKIIKIEGKKVRYNCHGSERFVLNKLVDLYENQFVEFKRLKGLHLQMILNYICGFLNSFGIAVYRDRRRRLRQRHHLESPRHRPIPGRLGQSPSSVPPASLPEPSSPDVPRDLAEPTQAGIRFNRSMYWRTSTWSSWTFSARRPTKSTSQMTRRFTSKNSAR